MTRAHLFLLALVPVALLALCCTPPAATTSAGQASKTDAVTTRRLVLIRHAKSDKSIPDIQDFDRPLEQRGRDDAKAMADWMSKKGICTERILYSPSVRTVQTLELLFGADPSQGQVRLADSSIYLAAPEDYLNVIAAQPDDAKCLVVVGHNPSTTMIVNRLQTDKVYEEVPTCGVNVITLNLEHWSEIRTAKGVLEMWMTPDELENQK